MTRTNVKIPSCHPLNTDPSPSPPATGEEGHQGSYATYSDDLYKCRAGNTPQTQPTDEVAPML